MTTPAAPVEPKPGPSVRMGSGGEFDLIRQLLGPTTDLGPAVVVGPGDDAAVLDLSRAILSTDLTIEGVHFRRAWVTLAEAGSRAVLAAASDLAAMAASPVAILVSLAVAADESDALGELGEGIRSAADALGVPLVGGDLTTSPGPIVIDVTVVGESEAPVTRAGAAAGDEMWVTGVLGGSAGAVHAWQEGTEPAAELREAFVRPTVRIEEALWLVDRGGVRAMIDLSDGLVGDAGHLAAAAGVRIVLDPGAVPIHGGLPEEEALRLAMFGGEDYELCFASTPGVIEPIVGSFKERFGADLTRVGYVEEGDGVHVRTEGGLRKIGAGGFDHFAPGRGSC